MKVGVYPSAQNSLPEILLHLVMYEELSDNTVFVQYLNSMCKIYKLEPVLHTQSKERTEYTKNAAGITCLQLQAHCYIYEASAYNRCTPSHGFTVNLCSVSDV